MEKKQSSLEWYIEESFKLQVKFDRQEISQEEYMLAYDNLLQQAKAMHKEEVKDAFVIRPYTNFENYYNETFGGTKN